MSDSNKNDLALGAKARKTFDRCDIAVRLGDPSDSLRQGLGRHHHVVGVGVNQHHAIDHYAHMPLPKHKVTALQPIERFGYIDVAANLGLLHIGITRNAKASGLQQISESVSILLI